MYLIHVQRAIRNASAPTTTNLQRWAKFALATRIPAAEITLRIVSEEESAMLNSTYRHKTGPTNVLSFPYAIPNNIQIETPLLGDIVICAKVVNRESTEQNKSPEAHWAHMVVHGVLHLLGYDHVVDSDAVIMEALETNILTQLGYDAPYQAKGQTHE